MLGDGEGSIVVIDDEGNTIMISLEDAATVLRNSTYWCGSF